MSGLNQNGVISMIIYPINETQFHSLLSYCMSNNLKIDVIGNLTNTYIFESYLETILISTIKFKQKIINNNILTCSCGYNLTQLSKWCVENSIEGFEGFIGIPGTVGAAAINNSGAFGSEMSKVVESVKILNVENKIQILPVNELEYSIRESILKRKEITGYVISANFFVRNVINKSTLVTIVEKNKLYRSLSIDGRRKSLGSIFVSASLENLYENHRIVFFLKKVCYMPFKLLICDKGKRNRINLFLTFLFLGYPKLSKHCDSLNRF